MQEWGYIKAKGITRPGRPNMTMEDFNKWKALRKKYKDPVLQQQISECCMGGMTPEETDEELKTW